MARQLTQGKACLRSWELSDNVSTDIVAWLRKQAKAGDILLAHSEDGVTWGRSVQDGKWGTSRQAMGHSPDLNSEHLWDARLFNDKREILIWRDFDADAGGVWHAREINETGEGAPAFNEWYDERQLLWGTHGERITVDGVVFTLLRDGAQGLRHAPPLEIPVDQNGALGDGTKAYLLVRHYLADDDVARVAASRLMKLAHSAGKANQEA